jgi:hypothetical protein
MLHLSELLTGVSRVLWPILAVLVFYRFRAELAACLAALAELIGRINLAEGFGVKISAEKKIQESQRSVIEKTAAAVAEEAILLSPLVTGPVELESLPKSQLEDYAPIVLTADEKRMRVMQLAAELDRETKLLALSAGIRNVDKPTRSLIEEVSKQLLLHDSVVASYLAFFRLRNEVAHHWDSALISDELLNSGRDLVRLIKSIPRLKITVLRTGVPLFSDPACTRELHSYSGIILQNTASDGVPSPSQIFPTLRQYRQGSNVTWEWDMNHVTGLYYYRDPFEGDEPRRGHDSSAAFAGRDIEELL